METWQRLGDQMARIIYVEDDELAGELVKEVLTEAGHLVGVIQHGTLAFDTIAFKRPDLVILDRSLPGMQGMEILTRLRQNAGTYLTPILMLTGKRDTALIDEALAAGADDYLMKPFQAEDLVQRVVAALMSKSFAAHRKIR
ncbi:MAG: response regulator [Oxalobacteraceae bacterium]|nr:MAG: response regulator [Oxalobacteraceae bacterium]